MSPDYVDFFDCVTKILENELSKSFYFNEQSNLT